MVPAKMNWKWGVSMDGKTIFWVLARKKFNVHVDPRNTVALSGLALGAVALKVELGPWSDQSGALASLPLCK